MRNRLKILLFFLIILNASILPNILHKDLFTESLLSDDSSFIGQVDVKRWQDDKSSAFSFSFDDGLLSQHTFAFPILEQYGFKGTFYLIPPYVTDSLPGIWRYGSWREFTEASDSGHEIGSHSMTHPHFLDLQIGDTLTEGSLLFELYQSKHIVYSKLPDKNCTTFAYPYSEHNSDVDYYTSLFYQSARAVGPEPNLYSLSDLAWFGLNSFPFTFDLPRDSLFDDLDEFEDFKNWVESTVSQSNWAIMQTHEVLPYSLLQEAIQNGFYEPVAAEWLNLVCSWIKEQESNNKVWVAAVADVTKYMKERDSYSYNLISADENKIQIELTDTLNNELYDIPLTADIIIPDNWNDVTLIQGSTTSFYNSFFDGANFVVRVRVIPDAGMIELYNGHLTNVESIAALMPNDFKLYQNYPNPFNPLTKIKFDLKNRSQVELSIFDMLGREITKLVDSEFESGSHEVTFNAKELASGIYFYKILVGNKQEVKKLILSK